MSKPVIRGALVAFVLADVALAAGSERAAAKPSSPAVTRPPVATVARPTQEGVKLFATEVQPILQSRCVSCHSGDKPQGGLKITSRETILKGGESGPAVTLQKPADSLILQAINYQGREMPPQGRLPQKEVEVLTRWIGMGMPWDPATASLEPKGHSGPPQVNDENRKFWAFQPVRRPAVPPVKNRAWVKTPIDAFILAKLEAAHLTPNPPASRVALIRRAYYDLTGLPPSPEEVRAFVADHSPNAWEKVVDRLLASPAYGERWGRHWLDLVRFAETNSYERDGAKRNAWRYRDYVIKSFNEDKPYDQFIKEQLAGDEMKPRTAEKLIATGYYRLGIWDDEPADHDQALYDDMDDLVSTTGQVFLGLTVGCARCHDHKLDPIPQKDYYRLVAFFAGVNRHGYGAESLRPITLDSEKAELEAIRRNVAATQAKIDEVEAKVTPDLTPVEKEEWQHEVRHADLIRARVPRLLGRDEYRRYMALIAERDQLRLSVPSALCVTESSPRDTFVLMRGNPHVPGDRVDPGFLSILTSATPKIAPGPYGDTSGRRTALADWIASKENPLTARVMVNRVWQYHFGRGIERSSSNFGFQGDKPTHPELLDWLSSSFVAGAGSLPAARTDGAAGNPGPGAGAEGSGKPGAPAFGWKLKGLHRLIMLSNAYQMSSEARGGGQGLPLARTNGASGNPGAGGQGKAVAAAHGSRKPKSVIFTPRTGGKNPKSPSPLTVDPENDLFWRFDMRRLEAEEIRDSILAVNGSLNRKMGGPSIYPTMPDEVLAGQSMPGAGWGKSTPEEQARRSVYIYVKRSLAVPLIAGFDGPETDYTCPVRFATTQPTQALGMINSAFVNEEARVFAAFLRKNAGPAPADQVRMALSRVLQRQPTKAEVDRGVQFLHDAQERQHVSAEEALNAFCVIALNLNEFIYLD